MYAKESKSGYQKYIFTPTFIVTVFVTVTMKITWWFKDKEVV